MASGCMPATCIYAGTFCLSKKNKKQEKPVAKSIIMKKYSLILFIIFNLLQIGCNKQKEPIWITGTIKNFDKDIIYLKQIDAFNYHDNSLLDSTKIDENGNFKIKVHETTPILLNISKSNWQHPINNVLQESPERYFYGYCAMFFIPEPTIFLDRYTNVELEWNVRNSIDSFAFSSPYLHNQDKFHKYYQMENLSKGLYQDGGSFKKMEVKIAWESINQEINKALDKYEVLGQENKNLFNNYMYTEIKLGAINMFLNWYENIYKNELEKDFKVGEIPKIYTIVFDDYLNHNWSFQSVEFFKMTERFITFNMNKSKSEFRQYYPSSKEKKIIAKEVLKSNVVDKYLATIKL